MRLINGKSRRLLAAILSVLMLFGMLSANASAIEPAVTITFGYLYQSDGSQILYQDSFIGTHGVKGGAGLAPVQIYADGKEAYCLEPGAPLRTGDVLTANASEAWNSLSSEMQNAIRTILAFGNPGNADGLTGSTDAKRLATQMIIWELVCGYREASSYALLDDCVFNAYCKNGANIEVANNYNTIVHSIRNWDVTPSFANGSTYEMNYQDGKYVLSLNDSNGVLGNYSVSSSDSNVKISKNGNTVTFSCDTYLSGNVTITAQKNSNISASAVLIPYGSNSLQDIVVGVARVGDVSASFQIATAGGSLNIVKNSEDGVVNGIEISVTGDGYHKIVSTGKDGTVSLDGLIPGTYTVSEAVASYYEPQEAKQITINSGETVTVIFHNKLKRGNLSVSKTSEDGFTDGVKFRLYGTSASGSVVDLYAVTDSTGVATFSDVLITGTIGYTLEEVDTSNRYVIPEKQNVAIAWNEMTASTVRNVLKKIDITVFKSDAETGTAQGDATLAGAVYGLYRDGELIREYVTDASGSFTTDYFEADTAWSIKEITPPEGYLLDETEYRIDADPEHYETEWNHISNMNVYEQVVKGNISIIKHSDDGSTQIETPEDGATFEVYLSSAGNYENAKESERDCLICDENGFAQTKDLPYGLYTVHQTAGNPDAELMKDFTVFISENGKDYRYLINNAPYSAYIRVVKADSETGNLIPLTGAGFEIYDASGNKVTMSYTYPTPTAIDTFYVSKDGYLITPQKLSAGNYQLIEVQAPYGYVLDSAPISFTVTSSDSEDMDGLSVITVTAYDTAQKGRIFIKKSGEIFTSVNVTGEEGVIDKNGTSDVISPIYSAVYETQNLEGATYQVIADEDIYTGDGTLRVASGTVVAEITTDKTGVAETEELYLGKYRIVEIIAPEGFVLNREAQIVNLTYAGQEIHETSASVGFVNDRQKLQITTKKSMEQDTVYDVGMNGEICAVSFGLYAKADIVAEDGSRIPANGLIEIAYADKDGNVSFESDLPFGSYYVKELTTDPHYRLDESIYDVEFSCSGHDTTIQTTELTESTIENAIQYGRIEGYKINDEVADETEAGLAGAIFGIFAEGTAELDEAHAITTVTSNQDGYFAFESVPCGDYLVVELKSPTGYVLSDARHFVSITYAGQVIGLKVINYPIIGSAELTKVDKDYPDNHLSGAEFSIYKDTNGDGTLDDKDTLLGVMTEYENGVYRMEGLRYGMYFVKETKAPEGFLMDEKNYAFSIVEDGQLVTLENVAGTGFTNQVIMGQITISKTDKTSGSKLVGAGFRVYGKDGKVVSDGKTGMDGTVSFLLRYGEYTVAEYEAPEGFVLDDTPYSFTINDNGQKMSVDMSNTKISGTLEISKADAATEKLLPNAGFRIYASDGKTVVKEGRTDKNGVCRFSLDFGKYYYQEFDAPDGYKTDGTLYAFSITEDGKLISVVMTNQKDEKVKDSEPTPSAEPKSSTTPKSTETPTPTVTPKTTAQTGKIGPKTGDDTDIGMWAGIAMIAIATAGVGGYCLYSTGKTDEKKKNKK